MEDIDLLFCCLLCVESCDNTSYTSYTKVSNYQNQNENQNENDNYLRYNNHIKRE